MFDSSNMLYGALFMMCGAYTLGKNAHVRGDFLYGSFRPRTQAALDLVCAFVFFLPGIGALLYAGWDLRGDLVATSASTPASPRTAPRSTISRP